MQLLHERMLLEDGRIAPALWAVKLRHDRRTLFHADLIDPILITVQRKQPTVAAQTDRIQRIKHRIGRQFMKGLQGG